MEKLHGGSCAPAHGRDYKTGADAKKAFLDGSDFLVQAGLTAGLGSIKDFAKGAKVQVRYKGQREVIVVRVP